MASLNRDGIDRRLACSERVLGWLNPSRLQARMSPQYSHRWDKDPQRSSPSPSTSTRSPCMAMHTCTATRPPLLIGSDLALHRIAEGINARVHHGQPSCSRVESSALRPDGARLPGRLHRGLEDPDRRVERASVDGLSRACSGAWRRRMLDAATSDRWSSLWCGRTSRLVRQRRSVSSLDIAAMNPPHA